MLCAGAVIFTGIGILSVGNNMKTEYCKNVLTVCNVTTQSTGDDSVWRPQTENISESCSYTTGVELPSGWFLTPCYYDPKWNCPRDSCDAANAGRPAEAMLISGLFMMAGLSVASLIALVILLLRRVLIDTTCGGCVRSTSYIEDDVPLLSSGKDVSPSSTSSQEYVVVSSSSEYGDSSTT